MFSKHRNKRNRHFSSQEEKIMMDLWEAGEPLTLADLEAAELGMSDRRLEKCIRSLLAKEYIRMIKTENALEVEESTYEAAITQSDYFHQQLGDLKKFKNMVIFSKNKKRK